MSAESDPLAPLAHHLQDSTHIAYDVITGGVTVHRTRVEASGFHGREPGENRWIITAGAIDSWSARVSAALARYWMAQYSLGHLHSPEALHPEEDVLRQTASVSFHHAWFARDRSDHDRSAHVSPAADLDATAIWGRNHTIGTNENANGYLLEAAPPAETVIGRVQAYTGGYAHRIGKLNWGALELGAQATLYNTPTRLIPLYGAHPVGVAGLLHLRIGK
jgi:hypothetical protein